MGSSKPGLGTPAEDALAATLAGAPPPPSPPPGGLSGTLGARYEIQRLLGSGGMGAVYLAHDRALAKLVAVKVVASGLEGLRHEVRLAQQVTHPNVCRTYDLEEVDGRWLLKMEYIDGETVAERVRRVGPLAVREAMAIARDVLDGLAHAHVRGVIHRDLKPQNIMLERHGGRVVLMDFGIAHAAETGGVQGIAGTPDFMAPEQASGKPVGPEADRYALGCVIHYMLAGRTLFPTADSGTVLKLHVSEAPPDVRTVRPEVPARLARLILRLLAKDPRQRPTVAEVRRVLAGGRRRAWMVAGAAGLVVAGAVAAFLALRGRAPAREEPWRPQIADLPAFDENSDGPSFSPDGQWITYASDRERAGTFRVYVAPAGDASGEARAVTPAGLNAQRPRWTRDGKALLFRKMPNEGLWRVPVAGGEPALVWTSSKAGDDCGARGVLVLEWTSPGCPLCGRLLLLAPDGAEREIVRVPLSQELTAPRCDRAGERALYVMRTAQPTSFPRGDVWLVSLAPGAKPRQLTMGEVVVGAAAFHPDGQSILYGAMRKKKIHLWQQPTSGGTPVELTFGTGPDQDPDVSPDGATVVYDVNVASVPLFAAPLAGGTPPRRITAALENLSYLSVVPGGGGILAAASGPNRSDVVVIDPADGRERKLAEGRTPSLSPDGKEVVYVAPAMHQLLAVPLAGGTPRVVADVSGGMCVAAGVDRAGVVHVAFVPDGTHRIEAWRVPTAGGTMERDLPPPWLGRIPSPDGRFAAYVDGVKNEVHLVRGGKTPEEGTAYTLVANQGVLSAGSWSRDGRTFLYDHRGIHQLDVDSGADKVVVPMEDSVNGLVLDPDAQTIYFTHIAAHTTRHLVTNFAARRGR